MITNRAELPGFWRNALAWNGSITPKVLGLVFVFLIYSGLITYYFVDYTSLNVDIGPFEVSGAILGLLLVFRTNAGYDRWWEARKLWGGIVNQCRNLALSGVYFGVQDTAWKTELISWVAAFPYACIRSLRNERRLDEISSFMSTQNIDAILKSRHMPSYVLGQMCQVMKTARDNQVLDDFSFLQMDKQRALLADHIGACERILKTPIPLVVAVKVRRFILLFLILVPFVLLQRVGLWTPLFMFIIAYPLLSIDQIGIELQHPFDPKSLSHLPLSDIASTIEKDVLSYLDLSRGTAVKTPLDQV